MMYLQLPSSKQNMCIIAHYPTVISFNSFCSQLDTIPISRKPPVHSRFFTILSTLDYYQETTMKDFLNSEITMILLICFGFVVGCYCEYTREPNCEKNVQLAWMSVSCKFKKRIFVSGKNDSVEEDDNESKTA